MSAGNPSILLQMLLYIGEILTSILNQRPCQVVISLTISRQTHLLPLTQFLLSIFLLSRLGLLWCRLLNLWSHHWETTSLLLERRNRDLLELSCLPWLWLLGYLELGGLRNLFLKHLRLLGLVWWGHPSYWRT